MILGVNTTCDISKIIVSNFTHLTAREIRYNNFKISFVVFMLNIPTDHAISYTSFWLISHCQDDHISPTFGGYILAGIYLVVVMIMH